MPCDFLVFGATGFTGKLIVERLLAVAPAGSRVGVSGRSREKLDAQGWGDAVEYFVVDLLAGDVDAVVSQCTSVVISAAGPFRFYGPPVVAACAKRGLAFTDISGEPEYLERMLLDHHDTAVASNACIVSACGFDSVPADIGAELCRRRMGDGACCVESFLSISFTNPKFYGKPALNYGTFESLVEGIGSAADGNLSVLRSDLKKTNELFKISSKAMISDDCKRLVRKGNSWLGNYDERVGKFILPFPGADAAVVRRTQRQNFLHNARPVQYAAYFTLQKRTSNMRLVSTGGMFLTLAKFKAGRKWLLKHPKFLSSGICNPNESPSEEVRAANAFEMLHIGTATTEEANARVTVRGFDPGYTATAAIIVSCALVMHSKRASLPSGVVTPATAFAGALDDLIEKLGEGGVIIE